MFIHIHDSITYIRVHFKRTPVVISVKSEGLQLPKILYKIVQSLKFGAAEDCKIATLSKQLLYITRDVTCDHVMYRHYRTLIHENLWENF